MDTHPSIKMVDLHQQYLRIKKEIDGVFEQIMAESSFIKGKQVKEFEKNLATYLGIKNVISCGNGTDALQMAIMSLNLAPDDEIIIPVHTYVATAEVIALLKLKPVFVDVRPDYFTIDPDLVSDVIGLNTKCIIPVHLYGQSSDMESLLNIAKGSGAKIIEDNAQALGSDFVFSNGEKKKTGTMGIIGTTSFFPTKPLGCYGDGGAIFSNDNAIARYCGMISNHGQPEKYIHDMVGINSRLDTMQAAFLDVKLKYIDQLAKVRMNTAALYDNLLEGIDEVELPARAPYSTHVFHQYTLKIGEGKRDDLKIFLEKQGIPTLIYYPIPLHKQKAYSHFTSRSFPVSEKLSQTVLSLPMHSELTEEVVSFISNAVRKFFKK